MKHKKISLGTVVELTGGELLGDENFTISNLNGIEAAAPNELTFAVKLSDAKRLNQSNCGAALVPTGYTGSLDIPVIKVADPNLAAAIVHNYLLEEEFQAKGIHPRSYIGENCSIDENVTISALAVIEDEVTIGEQVTIEPGAVVGKGAVIGDGTTLKANVTVAKGCVLGKRVTIHSGSVIGSDGYGYATDRMGNHVKRPQVGSVRIDDDVEIGSNVSIDRGAFGDTWIQSGTKIDNQVQIAHNVVIGPNSLIVAQAGLAGSCTLGRNVVLAGKVGINGHITLGDQVMVGVGSGVHHSLPAGSKVAGFPALPIKEWAKAIAVYPKLPEMHKELKQIKKIIESLKKQNSD